MPQPESDDPNRFDVAVLGSTPFALLVAGCLASQHGRRVALVGERFSPLRLPQTVSLSVGPFTRPDTWALLRGLERETLSLLGTAGAASAAARQPVTFRADLPATATMLDHMRHLAMGTGLKVTPLAKNTGFTVHHVAAINETALHPAIDDWLKGLGVVRLDATDATLTLPRRGDARIVSGGRDVTAGQIVLADDAALIAHLDPAQIPAPLVLAEATAVLTSPARVVPQGPTIFADRRVVLSARGRGLLAHILGPVAADARLASALEGELPLVRLATRRLRLLMSSDGAPVMGWLKDPKVFVAAGMLTIGPFLAPLAARAIAGASTAEDKKWLAAREPSRIENRGVIAEFALGSAA